MADRTLNRMPCGFGVLLISFVFALSVSKVFPWQLWGEQRTRSGAFTAVSFTKMSCFSCNSRNHFLSKDDMCLRKLQKSVTSPLIKLAYRLAPGFTIDLLAYEWKTLDFPRLKLHINLDPATAKISLCKHDKNGEVDHLHSMSNKVFAGISCPWPAQSDLEAEGFTLWMPINKHFLSLF